MGSKYIKYNDDDISMEEWLEQIDKVFEAYVREVGFIKQDVTALKLNVEILNKQIRSLAEKL